jgi:hypothetical protein
LWAQEAGSGLDLRATISTAGDYSHELEEQPRSGGPITGGFKAVLYPTWKLNRHWSVSGAVETHSRPYYIDEFQTQGNGVKTDVLQAYVSYSQFWKNNSVVVRVGQLSSAFGSFLLRYDDAVNPLIEMPLGYGYYTGGASTLGLAGAQVDATFGKLDLRAQFVNSSAANPRSVFDRDQYGNWAGGVGYTIRQGFRVGASSYRGPYLDRQSEFFFPGEAPPRTLPATAVGLDAQWGRGPWNVYGEWQHYQFDYHAIPTFREHTGYGEVRRVLTPRWYLAARAGYLRTSAFRGYQVYEVAAGYRPNRLQLIKVGYRAEQGPTIRGTLENVLAVQLVTSFRALSIARN